MPSRFQSLYPLKDKKVREYIEYLRKKYPPRKREEIEDDTGQVR